MPNSGQRVTIVSSFPVVCRSCWYKMFVRPVRTDVGGDPCLSVSTMVKPGKNCASLKQQWCQLLFRLSTSQHSYSVFGTLNHHTGCVFSCVQCPSGEKNARTVMFYQHRRLALVSSASSAMIVVKLSVDFSTVLWAADALSPQIFKRCFIFDMEFCYVAQACLKWSHLASWTRWD